MGSELRPSVEGESPPDPEEVEASASHLDGEIDAATKPGPVHLTIADLDRSIDFYESAIGLVTRERTDGRAAVGTSDTELLVLVEEAGARPAVGHTGLYHFALLVPERTDLARWLAHAARDGVPLTGMSDHYVSEALYLNDPDLHGIEIYCDRPREVWEGRVAERLTTIPLDVDDLFGVLDDPRTEPFDGLSSGTVMGHVHLKVSKIAETVAFYRDVVGFALMAQLGQQAAFLAAGGYHHHLGTNTWESAGATPPPAGTAALRRATFVLPDAAALDRMAARLSDAGHEVGGSHVEVTDPSGNPIAFIVGE